MIQEMQTNTSDSTQIQMLVYVINDKDLVSMRANQHSQAMESQYTLLSRPASN